MPISFARKPVRKFDVIADAPENEVAQLAAIAKGAGVCQDRMMATAGKIIDGARLDNENGSRSNRPVVARRQLESIVKDLTDQTHKPLGPNFSSKVSAFFETAVRAGYSCPTELAKDTNSKPDFILSLPSIGASHAAHDLCVREKGRKARHCCTPA